MQSHPDKKLHNIFRQLSPIQVVLWKCLEIILQFIQISSHFGIYLTLIQCLFQLKKKDHHPKHKDDADKMGIS